MSLLAVNQPVERHPRWWEFAWTDTGADQYWVYYRGALLATPATASITVRAEASGEVPQIEVADAETDRPLQYDHPGRIRLAAWSPPAAAGTLAYMRFDEYLAGSWVAVGYSLENDAQYHLWESGFLEDGSSHRYRIVPVFTDGTAGTPTEYTVLVVRHPTPAKAAAAVSGGTTPVATISEA